MSSSEVESIVQQLSEATVESGKKLSYSGKGLKLNSEEDAKEIEREIHDFNELEVLCLEGNTVGVDAAKAIARGLKNHPEFKRALWSDMFTGRMKTEIPPALKHLSEAMMLSGVKLVELDLSDNAFGPNGIKGVEDLLRSETCFTLQVLKLNNNGLGPSGGKILASCLDDCYNASLLKGVPMGLKVFVSGRGRLEDEGAKHLSAVFKKMGSLEFVAMPQNGIRFAGITELASAFAQNKSLKHLNLNDNTFTVKGAKAMAEALKGMHGLEVINFGDCLIRTEGAVLLAQALKDGHTSLKELILSGNEIQKEGGLAIANSFADKENITKIELGANNFGEHGVTEVKSILEPLGDVLDELDDDEGSEVDDEEEGEESDEDATGSEDDEIQVVKSDLMDIMEDPSVTKDGSSSVCMGNAAHPALDEAAIVHSDVSSGQQPIASPESSMTSEKSAVENDESEISEIREISVSMTEYDADISATATCPNEQISSSVIDDESMVIFAQENSEISDSARCRIDQESSRIAEEIVNSAIEAATAQVLSAQIVREIAEERDSETPLKLKNSGKKSRLSTPKRVSFSSLTNRKTKKSKENSMSDLTDKMSQVNIDSGEATSPSKTKARNEKECTIL